MKFSVKEELKTFSACTHGGRLVEALETSEDVVDFSASLNPFPFPNLMELLSAAIPSVHAYPDNRYRQFREAIGHYLNVDPDMVIPGNGSIDLIRLVAASTLTKGDKVAIPAPTFDEYEYACRLCGADIQLLPVWHPNNFVRKLKVLLSDEPIKMVFVCNPNNPTGKLMPRSQIAEIADLCAENGTTLFIDEVFIELADPSQSAVALDFENIFVLRSLTKSFAIPGLRVGYGITSQPLSLTLNCLRHPWTLNSIGDAATPLLLANADGYLQASREFITAERSRFVDRLQHLSGFKPVQSDANFIIVNCSESGLISPDLARRMQAHGFLIRDCSSFKLTDNKYVRLAVRCREENDKLLLTLQSVAQTESS